jgi:hypothetical protein
MEVVLSDDKLKRLYPHFTEIRLYRGLRDRVVRSDGAQ